MINNNLTQSQKAARERLANFGLDEDVLNQIQNARKDTESALQEKLNQAKNDLNVFLKRKSSSTQLTSAEKKDLDTRIKKAKRKVEALEKQIKNIDSEVGIRIMKITTQQRATFIEDSQSKTSFINTAFVKEHAPSLYHLANKGKELEAKWLEIMKGNTDKIKDAKKKMLGAFKQLDKVVDDITLLAGMNPKASKDVQFVKGQIRDGIKEYSKSTNSHVKAFAKDASLNEAANLTIEDYKKQVAKQQTEKLKSLEGKLELNLQEEKKSEGKNVDVFTKGNPLFLAPYRPNNLRSTSKVTPISESKVKISMHRMKK